MEKRGKLEKDSQIMIKMLPRQIELEKKMIQKSKSKPSNIREKLNQGVTFDYTDMEGRFATASRNINVGEEILCEKAHCVTLLQLYSKSHCQHCFTR